ncbi:hypothetical protein CHUAL_000183 [Chamberlinius hualienensis]
MSGYWLIIALVTLFTQPFYIKAESPRPFRLRRPIPYYAYDNPCTRTTPAVSVYKVFGTYKVLYSGKALDRCTIYEISFEEDYFAQITISPTANISIAQYIRSYGNPAKPGEMENYPIDTKHYQVQFIKPDSISTIAAYKKDVGIGIIICPPENLSNVTDFLVLANRLAKEADIDDLKNEVEKIIGGIEIHSIDQNGCP